MGRTASARRIDDSLSYHVCRRPSTGRRPHLLVDAPARQMSLSDEPEALSCLRGSQSSPGRGVTRRLLITSRTGSRQQKGHAALLQSPLTDSNRRPPPYHEREEGVDSCGISRPGTGSLLSVVAAIRRVLQGRATLVRPLGPATLTGSGEARGGEAGEVIEQLVLELRVADGGVRLDLALVVPVAAGGARVGVVAGGEPFLREASEP
jgi:hypothetical protein